MSATAADSGVDLTKKNNCMNCHGVDKKIVGPAFKDVAKKYKGNADAVALLSKKVKDGGSGVWGPIPMSPNKAVSDADIKVMVEYVLALN
ncbi:c-type cytochrome [Undibacterium sp. Ji22W]|uniref:c-type cytochrome n=1 Tax=Undibacterium sp. Ji22W TaxID=3413038 RepID=UPI003BF09529